MSVWQRPLQKNFAYKIIVSNCAKYSIIQQGWWFIEIIFTNLLSYHKYNCLISYMKYSEKANKMKRLPISARFFSAEAKFLESNSWASSRVYSSITLAPSHRHTLSVGGMSALAKTLTKKISLGTNHKFQNCQFLQEQGKDQDSYTYLSQKLK